MTIQTWELCPCVDCGISTVPQGTRGEWYMVHDDVWSAAGMNPVADLTQFLCIGCLERRIGRRLTPRDFTDASVNDPRKGHKTFRLQNRLTRGKRRGRRAS